MRPYHPLGSVWQMLTTRRPDIIDFWPSVFHGFWGIFDFYTLWMSPRIYGVLDVLLAGGMLGAAVWAFRTRRRGGKLMQQHLILATAVCAIPLVSLGLIINYSMRIDYQPQGRYLLTALVPFAIAILAGWEHLAALVDLRRFVAPLVVVLMVAINLLALTTTLVPGYHNRYLIRLLSQPAYTPRSLHGATDMQVNFVAEQRRIERLELLVTVPSEQQGPLVWQVRPAGAANAMLQGVDHQPPAVNVLYRIPVEQHQFIVGQRYVLTLQAPQNTLNHPLLIHLPDDRTASDSDLGLQVVYPTTLSRQTIQWLAYKLRTDLADSLRDNLQSVLYVVIPLLMLLLVVTALRSIVNQLLLIPIAIAVLALLLTTLAAPAGLIHEHIPTRLLESVAG